MSYIDARSWKDLGREQWLGLSLVVGGGLLAAVLAFAPSAFPSLNGKVAPMGAVMWSFAGSFLLQPDSAPDDETLPRRTPRYRRLMTTCLFLIGVALMAFVALT